MLIAADRYAEAEAAFREDLKRFPENGWALRGLAESLRRQDRRAEGEAVDARLAEAWATADLPAGRGTRGAGQGGRMPGSPE